MQRRGVEIHRHARHQRQHEADREAEGVERRQHVEHLVAASKVDAGGRLSGVGQHVGVRQHHALGRALGAGGEQDRGRRTRPPRGDRLVVAPQGLELVGGRDRFADVLQVDDADMILQRIQEAAEASFLDEGP